jgi:hypothetical protein
MCLLIEKIAADKGINVADANYIFTFISGHLVSKIPALSQVIEDVFENVETDKLQEDIHKAAEAIQQQQWREKFKNFQIPPETYVIHQTGGGLLF